MEKLPNEALLALGQLVADLLQMRAEMTDLPEGVEFDEASIKFSWKPTGESLTLALRDSSDD